MIRADLVLLEVPLLDEGKHTMRFNFQVILRNNDKFEGELSWPVALPVEPTQEPWPSPSSQQQLQRAFAVLEVQLAAIRQTLQLRPDYDRSRVAMYKSALATQDAEQFRKS